MEGVVTNVTAILLTVAGLSIITGSQIWILFSEPITSSMATTFSSTSLASCLSITIGFVLSQINLMQKNRIIKELSHIKLEDYCNNV